MKENTLVVSEVFHSIQGEGQTMGVPAVFLRLAGCNLLCESKHWRCDTIEVWQKGKSTLFENVLDSDLVNVLLNGAHLIITGGEPLLQQSAIEEYLKWFYDKYKVLPTVEIETNGTIIPNEYLLNFVEYWNISPKLPNSGMSFEKRVNEAAILTVLTMGKNSILKFVVNCEEDIIPINDEYLFAFEYGADVMLMPAGSTQEELKETRPAVVEICKRYGYRFSDRLHIMIWDKKTGV